MVSIENEYCDAIFHSWKLETLNVQMTAISNVPITSKIKATQTEIFDRWEAAAMTDSIRPGIFF